MKSALVFAVAAMSIGNPALAADRIGENCSGSETVRFGTQAPKTVPYEIDLNVDLAAKLYCYDRCGRDQTFAISDITSHLIKLANTNHGGQRRVMTFYRRSATLTDHQEYDAGLGKVIRSAKATCRVAPFREPAGFAQTH